MTMCGVSEFWQKVIRGAVIILAVVIDQTQRNLQAKMQKAVVGCREPKGNCGKRDTVLEKWL